MLTNRLFKRGASLAAALALGMTMMPASLAAAEDVQYVHVEATDTQRELMAVSKQIIEVDGLKFKDLNANGTLDVYEDWRVDADTRTADLLSQMTIRERIAQMQHPTFTPKDNGKYPSYLQKWMATENIGMVLVREFNVADSAATAATTMNKVQEWCEESRLGVPVVVSMDSVHGASYVNGATVTGHNLSQAATRDEDLVTRLAEIQRNELMAMGVRMTLSPEADIASEPRWGRVMETFGEDPELVTQMIRAQIVAYQNGSEGLNDGGIIACIKHFPGAGPQMDGLDQAPIVSTEESLQTHLKPYYAALEVNVGSVMPYYSIPLVLDTTAALGSRATLQDLLRNGMGFEGIIQTDWGMIWGIQQSTSMWGDECSEEEAILIGVMEGQVDGIGGESIRLIDQMEELYGQGKITEEVINAAATRVLREKFQLGIFENPYVDVAYAAEYVGCDANQAVNLEAAEKAMTLLKNDGILPLESAGKKILVAGMRAGDMDSLCGGWTSSQEGTTLAQALAQLAGEGAEVIYEAEDVDKITELAKTCDVAIIAVGEASYQHNPTWGYNTLEITQSQQDILEAVKATGTPIITVIIGGRPYIMSWCDENTNAILMAYYPGQQGGIAIAKTIYGMNNPTGKLPMAMPRDMASVEAQESDISFDLEDPLYEYGFGLSYGE